MMMRKSSVIIPVMLYRMLIATAVVGAVEEEPSEVFDGSEDARAAAMMFPVFVVEVDSNLASKSPEALEKIMENKE